MNLLEKSTFCLTHPFLFPLSLFFSCFVLQADYQSLHLLRNLALAYSVWYFFYCKFFSMICLLLLIFGFSWVWLIFFTAFFLIFYTTIQLPLTFIIFLSFVLISTFIIFCFLWWLNHFFLFIFIFVNFIFSFLLLFWLFLSFSAFS